MELRRTANAGVLLTLDGVTVLLDGVCRELEPYMGTPAAERRAIEACPPDILAFTHGHMDHFDRAFARALYEKNLRPILGPESLLKEGTCQTPVTVGGVTVTPIRTRHVGAAGKDTPHMSFLIRGSKTVLFTGDASPVVWKSQERVDVLIAPYAYATVPGGWKVADTLADTLVLLHLPERERDPYRLWEMVENTTAQYPGPKLLIPQMGQPLRI